MLTFCPATPLIPPLNSPSVGERRTATVNVPATALNGIISFALESLQVSISMHYYSTTLSCFLLIFIDEFHFQVSVEEPSDFPSLVQLTLTRSGSFGAATITWVVTTFNADIFDIGANTGTVTFPSGSNTTQLEIFISPDDVPEIDELFTVTMVSVSPSSQRIDSQLVCLQ